MNYTYNIPKYARLTKLHALKNLTSFLYSAYTAAVILPGKVASQ